MQLATRDTSIALIGLALESPMATVNGRIMETLGLTPEKQFHSDPRANRPASGVARAMLYGGISFCLVSVLAYSIWAFRLVPGTAGLYSATAAVYIGLSGLALSRLVRHG